jgi:chemotaxis protein methyltransferase CheR
MSSALARSETGHEFGFSDHDFEQVRRLIYEHAGISLSPAKREMVYSRLSRRLRVHGLDTFQAYLRLLDAGDAAEWEAFTNALTTNLTAFFREPHHFPQLAEHVRKHCQGRSVTLWCSAASTGEEPYSMAMTMVELFNTWTPPVKILATDLDTSVLAKAEAGEYADERIEKLPTEQVKRFFLRGAGANAGQVRVRPELRKLVTFRRLNLLDAAWPMRGPFDVIFCRNVMIYFDKPTQLRILERFAPLLRPEGILFAGHSESFHNAGHLFRLRGKTVYELARPKSRS